MANLLRSGAVILVATLLGLWTISPAAALPRDVERLVSNSHFCWAVQEGPETGKVLNSQQMRTRAVAQSHNMYVDLNSPGETYIIGHDQPPNTGEYSYQRVPCPEPPVVSVSTGVGATPSPAVPGDIEQLVSDSHFCWLVQEGPETGKVINSEEMRTRAVAQSHNIYVDRNSQGGPYIIGHDQPPNTGEYSYQRVPCPQHASGNSIFYLNGGIQVGLVENTSTTKIISPTDQQKVKQDSTQAIIVGDANFGQWFVTGQVTFAGTPRGTFSDVFPAFPGLNTTATVTSGNVNGFNGDAGYTLLDAAGWRVGIFGGYYSFNEELAGMFPGFAGTFPLLSDHWRAGESGVTVDKAFAIGTEPFHLNMTVAGLYDNLRAGAFNGNGGGVRAKGTLSFPLGPVIGNIYAQYTDLNASGSNAGVPLTFKDDVWAVGFGVTFKFGGMPPSSMKPLTR